MRAIALSSLLILAAVSARAIEPVPPSARDRHRGCGQRPRPADEGQRGHRRHAQLGGKDVANQ